MTIRRLQRNHRCMLWSPRIHPLASVFVWTVLAVLGGCGVQSQDCPMAMWVFDSLDDCRNPRAVGEIYADGSCHSLTDEPDYPGNYIAQCTSDGRLLFIQSGCADNSCGSCETDQNQQSSLYARSPSLLVQEVLASRDRFQCNSFTNNIVAVYFAFYGDCSAPGCVVDGAPNPTAPPPTMPIAAPSPRPTRPPAPRPTPDPTPRPSPRPTRRPTPRPTPRPTYPPTTRAPNPLPTTNWPTRLPVQAPVTNRPTPLPTKLPVAAPVTGYPTLRPTTRMPSRSPLAANVTKYPTIPPITEAPALLGRKTETAEVEMVLSPVSAMLTSTDLNQWAFITTSRIRFASPLRGNLQAQATDMKQQVITEVGASALLIVFNLTVEMEINAVGSALNYYLDTFDETTEKAMYLSELKGSQGVEALHAVEMINAAKARDPQGSTDPDTPADENTNKSSDSPGSPITMILAGVGSVSAVVLAGLAMLLFRSKRRRQRRTSKPETAESEPEITVQVEDCRYDSKQRLMLPDQQPAANYTHDIVVRRGEDDDISTLGGFTGMMTGTVKDDATASVHEDYDFDNNVYRTESVHDQTYSHASTMFSAHTALERLGAMLFNDDKSLDQQFLDDGMNKETTTTPAKRTRISPFEVRAPPGLLGMVVDSLTKGGTPVVRAIQPNSVLEGRVRIGDRLLSVNHKDVTGLSAKEVSNLISFKQNEERLLKFVRIE